ncbi:FCD domain-containing protein [Paenibacillus sp. LMG 31460]|uniref:FCD domain-containing protein n=1 Tax=Paenibacillus germinis TaxID=2654979 RepID=A0ABX1Z822_9BACL|nr:GntR family transcriptional regulator [Paenibacillus germinis]NOU88386.1 FCD domain-containing protein [Paenibacillus germinis]
MKALSTKDSIYSLLKDDILKLILLPGDRISEKEISDKFKVSRTPVRESFLQLSQEGLLDIYPQKGTCVSLIDLNLVEEARFMRENLEIAVIKLACENFSQEKLFSLEMNLKMQEICMQEKNHAQLFQLDEGFHQTIFEECKKSNIWLMIQQMNLPFHRIRMLRLATDFNWENIYHQHVMIVEAIKNKKPEVAVKVIQEHLTMVVFDKEKLKKEFPSYFK